jgi:hypothetical protein
MTVPAAIVLVKVMLATSVATADEPFFPDRVFDTHEATKGFDRNDFIVRAYSKHLKAMKEPSLWKLSQKDRKAIIYRFLWLPSFHRPVSVRLVKTDAGAVLHAVELDGKGGYEPGKIAVRKRITLSDKQWEETQRRLDKTKFWAMPTEDHERGGVDGDQLILEGVMAGKYHIVDRWSPEAGNEYTQLCLYMLTLSDLDVMKTWQEYRE